MKKRQGSTLAAVIIVFAILMILGTTVLYLMVNDNKISIRHENKTQAYYVARSGAVVAEAAVLELYDRDDDTEWTSFLASLASGTEKTIDDIVIDDGKAKVSFRLEIIPVGPEESSRYLLHIVSKSTVRDISETVVKELKIQITEDKDIVKVKAPITYLDVINQMIKDVEKEKPGFVFYDSDPELIKYPLFKFNPIVFPDELLTVFPTSGDLAGNYYVENLNALHLHNRKIGKVNIYVKRQYYLKEPKVDLKINVDGEANNLNIYVYGVGETNSVDLKETVKDGNIKSNLFVDSGNVKMVFHKLKYTGNIVLGSVGNAEFIVGDNANDPSYGIDGTIYGPASTINIGDENHGSVYVTSGIIGNTVNYNVNKINPGNIKKFKIGIEGGINNPIELGTTAITTLNTGYFK